MKQLKNFSLCEILKKLIFPQRHYLSKH